MTLPKSPRIDINPSKVHRNDFDLDSFILMNLPGVRAEALRETFKLIWLAHQICEARYNQEGLRAGAYLQIKNDIEEQLSKEKGREITMEGITEKRIKQMLRHMRKAGYLRYVPLEDRWYFSSRAASTLKKMATNINDFQTKAVNRKDANRLIYDFGFGL